MTLIHNNTSDKLRSCDFCGSSWVALDILTEGDIMYVQCNNCDSTGGVGHTKEEVIHNWNKERN